MIRFLSIDDILESHSQQILRFGGSEGIRDINLLHSAASQPSAAFGGEFLHRDLFEMAAAYLFHLVQNHPFIDGNKRVGLETALLFLRINHIQFDSPDDLLFDLVIATASGKRTKAEIAQFFREHSR